MGLEADVAAATEAIGRWERALAARGDLARTREAFAEEAVVRRFQWSEGRQEQVAEEFAGVEAIDAWLQRSPADASITADWPVTRDGDGWRVGYRVRYGDYVNQGAWWVAIGEDGRIARLDHRPDDVPEAWRRGIPEGKRLPGDGRGEIGPGSHDHDHGHER